MPKSRAQKEADFRREQNARKVQQLITVIQNQPVRLKGLKPWQMTRAEWQEIVRPVFDAFCSLPLMSEEAGQVANAFLERYGLKHIGYDFKPDTPSNWRHEVHVAVALEKGLPVPRRVLEDYPSEFWEQTFDLRHIANLARTPAINSVRRTHTNQAERDDPEPER